MLKPKKIIYPVLSAALAFVFLISCQPDKNGTEEAREGKGGIELGGILKVNEPQKPKTLYPAGIMDAYTSHVAAQVHSGLVRFNPSSLEIIPDIAESWEMDKSETVYTFKLNKGARFHACECFGNEGRAVTAKDVKYSLELLCTKSEDNKAFEATLKGKILGGDDYYNGKADELKGVKVVDDQTVEITLTKPNSAFLYLLAEPAASIIGEEAVEKDGTELTCGAGPFVYGKEGEKLKLKRHAGFHLSDQFGNQYPYVDELQFSFLPTKEEELKAFFDGELDIVNRLYLDPVKQIMEKRINEFQGKNARYVLERHSGMASYELYSLYRKSVKNYHTNFKDYRDYSVVYLSDKKAVEGGQADAAE